MASVGVDVVVLAGMQPAPGEQIKMHFGVHGQRVILCSALLTPTRSVGPHPACSDPIKLVISASARP